MGFLIEKILILFLIRKLLGHFLLASVLLLPERVLHGRYTTGHTQKQRFR